MSKLSVLAGLSSKEFDWDFEISPLDALLEPIKKAANGKFVVDPNFVNLAAGKFSGVFDNAMEDTCLNFIDTVELLARKRFTFKQLIDIGAQDVELIADTLEGVGIEPEYVHKLSYFKFAAIIRIESILREIRRHYMGAGW